MPPQSATLPSTLYTSEYEVRAQDGEIAEKTVVEKSPRVPQTEKEKPVDAALSPASMASPDAKDGAKHTPSHSVAAKISGLRARMRHLGSVRRKSVKPHEESPKKESTAAPKMNGVEAPQKNTPLSESSTKHTGASPVEQGVLLSTYNRTDVPNGTPHNAAPSPQTSPSGHDKNGTSEKLRAPSMGQGKDPSITQVSQTAQDNIGKAAKHDSVQSSDTEHSSFAALDSSIDVGNSSTEGHTPLILSGNNPFRGLARQLSHIKEEPPVVSETNFVPGHMRGKASDASVTSKATSSSSVSSRTITPNPDIALSNRTKVGSSSSILRGRRRTDSDKKSPVAPASATLGDAADNRSALPMGTSLLDHVHPATRGILLNGELLPHTFDPPGVYNPSLLTKSPRSFASEFPKYSPDLVSRSQWPVPPGAPKNADPAKEDEARKDKEVLQKESPKNVEQQEEKEHLRDSSATHATSDGLPTVIDASHDTDVRGSLATDSSFTGTSLHNSAAIDAQKPQSEGSSSDSTDGPPVLRTPRLPELELSSEPLLKSQSQTPDGTDLLSPGAQAFQPRSSRRHSKRGSGSQSQRGSRASGKWVLPTHPPPDSALPSVPFSEPPLAGGEYDALFARIRKVIEEEDNPAPPALEEAIRKLQLELPHGELEQRSRHRTESFTPSDTSIDEVHRKFAERRMAVPNATLDLSDDALNRLRSSHATSVASSRTSGDWSRDISAAVLYSQQHESQETNRVPSHAHNWSSIFPDLAVDPYLRSLSSMPLLSEDAEVRHARSQSSRSFQNALSALGQRDYSLGQGDLVEDATDDSDVSLVFEDSQQTIPAEDIQEALPVAHDPSPAAETQEPPFAQNGIRTDADSTPILPTESGIPEGTRSLESTPVPGLSQRLSPSMDQDPKESEPDPKQFSPNLSARPPEPARLSPQQNEPVSKPTSSSPKPADTKVDSVYLSPPEASVASHSPGENVLNRESGVSPHVPQGSPLVGDMSTVVTAEGETVTMAEIKQMDKIELYLRLVSSQAEMAKAHAERDALIDAMHEALMIGTDLRNQRDDLDRRLGEALRDAHKFDHILGPERELHAPRLEYLVRSRDKWNRRAIEYRMELGQLRLETDLLRKLVNWPAKDGDVESTPRINSSAEAPDNADASNGLQSALDRIASLEATLETKLRSIHGDASEPQDYAGSRIASAESVVTHGSSGSSDTQHASLDSDGTDAKPPWEPNAAEKTLQAGHLGADDVEPLARETLRGPALSSPSTLFASLTHEETSLLDESPALSNGSPMPDAFSQRSSSQVDDDSITSFYRNLPEGDHIEGHVHVPASLSGLLDSEELEMRRVSTEEPSQPNQRTRVTSGAKSPTSSIANAMAKDRAVRFDMPAHAPSTENVSQVDFLNQLREQSGPGKPQNQGGLSPRSTVSPMSTPDLERSASAGAGAGPRRSRLSHPTQTHIPSPRSARRSVM